MKLSKKFTYTALHAKSDGCCFYCGVSLDEDSCTIDHIIPKILGGGNDFDNLAISCKSCNSSKGGKDIGDFKLRKSFEYAGCPHKFTALQIKWLLTEFSNEFVEKSKSFKFKHEGGAV